MDRIDHNHPLSKSENIDAARMQALRTCYPEVFTEDKVDFELLREVLGDIVDEKEERFSFSWKGKTKARREASKPSYGTLRPAPDKSLDWDKTQNIFIEGENLEALKLLQKSYHGKVDVIYIDPPYNTGKDFVYKDDYRDNLQNYLDLTNQIDESGRRFETNSEISGRYHSDWLSMMYPRLKLARNLLSEKGVIFISIDDHEVHNLRNLCNEVFGEENFVTEFIWEKKKKPSFLHTNVGKLAEYIVCYVKNQQFSFPFSVEKTTKRKKYPFNNAGNGIRDLLFPARSVQFDLPDQTVPAQDMSEGKIITTLLNPVEIQNGTNSNAFTLRGEWRYSQDFLNRILTDEEAITISNIPFRPNHVKPGGEIKKMKNCFSLLHYKMETNEDGTEQLIDLLGGDYFGYPKPLKLMTTLIKSVTYDNPNALVMDFFAGTATCAQGVWLQNQEDGGRRRFVMIQLPEPTYIWEEGKKVPRKSTKAAFEAGFESISEIALKRISEASQRMGTNRAKSDSTTDIGFKAFFLDTSNLKTWDPQLANLPQSLLDYIDPIKPDRKQNDLLYEIILKYGLDLALPVEILKFAEKTVFNLGYGALILCLENEITIETVEGIARTKTQLQPEICRVVFRDSGFKSDILKTTALRVLRDAEIIDVKSI
jgi:adenine-specific DNA-methyltransferase